MREILYKLLLGFMEDEAESQSVYEATKELIRLTLPIPAVAAFADNINATDNRYYWKTDTIANEFLATWLPEFPKFEPVFLPGQ